MIDLTSVLARRSDVRYRHVPPETVLIRQSGPEVILLNGIAGRVLDLIDGRRSLAELVAALADEFEAPRPTLESDVLAFASELHAAAVVEIVPPVRSAP